MERQQDSVIIVGGGSAGWITAGLVAAELRASGRDTEVVLVESPDVPIIGVGEGSWPSMRMTLQRIGLAESQLLANCEATFKQGTRFINWTDSSEPSSYLHPFSLPMEYASLNLAEHWLAEAGERSFAEFVTPQAAVIEAGLAPKQPATPEFAFNVNYGYHFDAGKFARLLHDHTVGKLGVRYVSANLVEVDLAGNGDVQAIRLDNGEHLQGSLFVDCTGQRALLIGRYREARFVSVRNILLNDTALALQLPYQDAAAPLPSTTHATAVPSGWIWDIGLQTRRGIGHVYSSSHASAKDAEQALRHYVRQVAPQADFEQLSPRRIEFDPGYREQFWVGNCVAVGLSGGFIEPLEASALALIEQAAGFISSQLPANRETMTVVARRFNDKMGYHWSRIIEFLKLHYVLSRRTEAYWLAARDPASCPDGLRDKLLLWQQQAPWHDDAPRVDELFPSASYQYVLYGMGFRPSLRSARGTTLVRDRERAASAVREAAARAQQMRKLLPTNRQLIHTLAPLRGAA